MGRLESGKAGRVALRRAVQRARNGLRKAQVGLTLFGESVSPESPNDLFQAHLSIYAFFATFVYGRRVLDLGCGTGYGTAHLVSAGASEAVGLDRDVRALRYARRVYGRERLRFVEGDISKPPAELGSFDTIISSNAFEHVPDPDAALDAARRLLRPEGTFVLAVPPILSSEQLHAHGHIGYHRSNLYVGHWEEKLGHRFRTLRRIWHGPPVGIVPDLTDPFPSRLRPCDFRFRDVETFAGEAGDTITAIFVAR